MKTPAHTAAAIAANPLLPSAPTVLPFAGKTIAVGELKVRQSLALMQYTKHSVRLILTTSPAHCTRTAMCCCLWWRCAWMRAKRPAMRPATTNCWRRCRHRVGRLGLGCRRQQDQESSSWNQREQIAGVAAGRRGGMALTDWYGYRERWSIDSAERVVSRALERCARGNPRRISLPQHKMSPPDGAVWRESPGGRCVARMTRVGAGGFGCPLAVSAIADVLGY